MNTGLKFLKFEDIRGTNLNCIVAHLDICAEQNNNCKSCHDVDECREIYDWRCEFKD